MELIGRARPSPWAHQSYAPEEAALLHVIACMIEQPSKPDIPRPPDPIDRPPPDIKPVPPPDIPLPGGPPDVHPPTFPERGSGTGVI